jgi:hypothetical protein
VTGGRFGPFLRLEGGFLGRLERKNGWSDLDRQRYAERIDLSALVGTRVPLRADHHDQCREECERSSHKRLPAAEHVKPRRETPRCLRALHARDHAPFWLMKP